jgi:D-alanyl-D-alanine dipeptidase
VSPIASIAEPPIAFWPPIQECREPLISVVGPRLRVKPVYAELGLEGASGETLLRTGALARLNEAADSLPDGLGFLILDAYRPLTVQQALWDWQERNVRAEHPCLPDDAIADIVKNYVAFPTDDPLRPTPHRTGGAVDLTVISLETGEELAMGTAFDEASERAQTDWFERHPTAPVTENRRLLYTAMTGAGFANYPGEWWHYEWGTRRWAVQRSQPHALYGGLE